MSRREWPRRIALIAAVALTAAAIAKELSKPRDEREWNGRVAGFVPYDFRPPTLDRFGERVWNPEGSNLFSPQVFGVGWTVNVGRLARVAGLA
jgi:hypothetical protein